MEEVLQNGSEVLIFKHNEHITENYIKGKIISSFVLEGMRGYKSLCYTVLGEDGVEYLGERDRSINNSAYFKTKEDYIIFLHKESQNPNNTESKIIKIEKIIESLNGAIQLKLF